jgi:hypothetical protein
MVGRGYAGIHERAGRHVRGLVLLQDLAQHSPAVGVVAHHLRLM